MIRAVESVDIRRAHVLPVAKAQGCLTLHSRKLGLSNRGEQS